MSIKKSEHREIFIVSTDFNVSIKYPLDNECFKDLVQINISSHCKKLPNGNILFNGIFVKELYEELKKIFEKP